jgi:hypothetical protein
MPRPLRIEYENAFYYVINKERERQNNYMDKIYRTSTSAL